MQAAGGRGAEDRADLQRSVVQQQQQQQQQACRVQGGPSITQTRALAGWVQVDSLCSARGDNESEAARRIKTQLMVEMQVSQFSQWAGRGGEGQQQHGVIWPASKSRSRQAASIGHPAGSTYKALMMRQHQEMPRNRPCRELVLVGRVHDSCRCRWLSTSPHLAWVH
jgi:hypothetical protein